MNTETDVVFVSHGGGPRPLLGDPDHQEMVDRLTELAANLRKPKAILVISAHWEESAPTITAGSHPSLIYDYHGFPSEPTTSSTRVPANLNWRTVCSEHWSRLACRRDSMTSGALTMACLCH
ncbi:class III extradiol ring-cleavage dioxygenase family protein [Marinobacter similis]|uniref:hypothetical protein n=1 Tax=Marinobacter similis TaxID=1420916 RepID=UPI001F345389|nr:hypothetical protein [Marinobacter similis]